MHITTTGIAALINEASTANILNRRSKGILHLGSKQGGEYAFTLSEAVCMVLIRHLMDFVTMAEAHAIGEDPEIKFVLDHLDDDAFANLNDVHLHVAKTSDGTRVDAFLIAGSKDAVPTFQWSGAINHAKKSNRGLKRIDADLRDLLPPVMLTIDLRKLALDVELAVAKLPRKHG